jgi:hypothetical protein
LAFANDLIAGIQPSLLVELGTHWGESYFSFCQSVFQNGLDCLCYGVDHWLGEPHAGHYGEEVFTDVQQFNETHYRGFSYLLRTGFDEAREQFSDDSIDLLHIDGLHTYEAVSHDFRSWLPKVKPGGIILLHDIAVRHADFGVWRLWDELKDEFPQSFEFHHWWGLGVLQKPGRDSPSVFLDLLFHSSAGMAERIRRHYLMQTAYLENTRVTEAPAVRATAQPVPPAGDAASAGQQTQFQIYLAGPSGYSEDNSMVQPLELDRWQHLSFALPSGTGQGRLRIDPSERISVIEIGRIALTEEATGQLLFRADAAEDFREFEFSESALTFGGDAACCFVSFSKDPYLVLPAGWRSDQSVRLDISIHVQTTLSAVAQAFQLAQAAAARDQHRMVHEALVLADAKWAEEMSKLRQELAKSQRDSANSKEETERLEGVLAATTGRMRQEMQREVRILQELLDNAEDRVKREALKAERLAEIEEELQRAKDALVREHALLENEQALRVSMLQSKSWTLTKPLRDVIRRLKG